MSNKSDNVEIISRYPEFRYLIVCPLKTIICFNVNDLIPFLMKKLITDKRNKIIETKSRVFMIS